jgi:drug/metabolite transporter (DMT)-like permease
MSATAEVQLPVERNPTTVAYLSFAAICLIWGTTFLAIRVAVETIPTLMLTGIRFTAAGLILMAIARIRREALPATRREWIDQIVNGVVMVSLANSFLVWAEHHITSGLAALLAATIPLWMAAMEMATGTASLTVRKSVGLLAGFAGVGLLVLPGLQAPDTSVKFFLAVGAVQLSTIFWNAGSLRAKHQRVTAGPTVIAAIHTLSGGLLVGVISLAMGDAARLTFTPRTFIALLHLIIFGSVVAYSAYLYALARLQPAKLSLYAYVNPAVAVVVGWMILREPLTLRMILAMAVILSGVAIVQSERLKRS